MVDSWTCQDSNISDETCCSINIPRRTLDEDTYSGDALVPAGTGQSIYIQSNEEHPCGTASCLDL